MSELITTVKGKSRASHAAAIKNMGKRWGSYEALHNDLFEEVGARKCLLINSEGKVIEQVAKRSELSNADGTVRHEDFMVIREEIVRVRRRVLNGVTDLMAAGLSFPVAISEQLVGFEFINEFRQAVQEMNPNKYQNNDTTFSENYVPNPITHQSFDVPWRQQGFDYKRSLGMSESVRQVGERLEETLFNGNTDIVVNFNGANQSLFGYTTHPDRGTGTISDWSLVANVALIIPELIDLISSMFTDQGGIENDSIVLYLANDIWNIFQNDYKAEVAGTVMARAMQIAQIKDVKPAEKLASTEVVLVEMQARTIEMAVATDIITVPHIKTDPMEDQTMTTYAAMVHQIKVDSNSNTGILHATT